MWGLQLAWSSPCAIPVYFCVSGSTVPAGFGEAGLEEESGKLHPLSSAQEMEDGLQDSTEERAGKGFLEESLDGPFGLLSWAVDSLQLADLLGWHFLFGLCAAGFTGCPVPSMFNGTARCGLLQYAWKIRQQCNG